jgi:hypothetical protein
LALLTIIFFSLFFASSVPSPLFIVFQHRWGFSAGMLTLAFGSYAIILLVILMVAGSLSDHVGRRPVILAALCLQVTSMALFLAARGSGGLIGARIAQGLSMGIANGALSAGVIEAAPIRYKKLAALLIGVSPMAGLAAGALVAGVCISFAEGADVWIFLALAALFTVFAGGILFIPETSHRRPGALASLVPRISVAPRARYDFTRGLPLLFVIWALCGLVISLAPSLISGVFGIDSGGLNGVAVAVFCGAGAICPLFFAVHQPSTTATLGIAGVAAGLIIILGSLSFASVGFFVLGMALAGGGCGLGFSGLVQLLAPLADPHERAELFVAIFVATYLPLSLPPIAVGFLIPTYGLLRTTQAYLFVLLAVSLFGLFLRIAAVRPRKP